METEQPFDDALTFPPPAPLYRRKQTGKRGLIQAVNPVTPHRYRITGMKRHLTSRLQRRHTEFEGPRETHRAPRSGERSEAVTTDMRDGYDWLARIKANRVARVSARG